MTLPTGTWRRKSGLASWDFQLPGAYPAAVGAALAALGDFAQVRRVRLTTASGGEGARTLQSADVDVDVEVIVEALEQVPDLEDVEVDLALLVVAPDNAPNKLVQSRLDDATLWITWEGDDGVEERGHPVRLLLSLDVDIYAARSRGDDRDNRAMAALNGPRLAGFLDRLRAAGAVFFEVDAPSYPGAGPTGFDAPR